MSDRRVGRTGRDGARPEFAVTWRGYDRRQVDKFAERQLVLLQEARRGLHEAREGSTRDRPAFGGLEAAPPIRFLTATPRSFEELGEQVGRILREAWTVSEEIRADARREATEILQAARAEARQLTREEFASD